MDSTVENIKISPRSTMIATKPCSVILDSAEVVDFYCALSDGYRYTCNPSDICCTEVPYYKGSDTEEKENVSDQDSDVDVENCETDCDNAPAEQSSLLRTLEISPDVIASSERDNTGATPSLIATQKRALPQNVDLIECSICLTKVEDLKLHLQECFGNRKICPLCLEVTFEIEEHLRDLHDGTVCKTCNKRFTSMIRLQNHIVKAHTDEVTQFTCCTCGRGFFLEMYMLVHLINVHNIVLKPSGPRTKTQKSRKQKAGPLSRKKLLTVPDKPPKSEVAPDNVTSHTDSLKVWNKRKNPSLSQDLRNFRLTPGGSQTNVNKVEEPQSHVQKPTGMTKSITISVPPSVLDDKFNPVQCSIEVAVGHCVYRAKDKKTFIITCRYCDVEFHNHIAVACHLIRAHEIVSCNFCSASFSSEPLLQAHERDVHQLRDQQCLQCAHQFKSTSNLYSHYIKDHDTHCCRACKVSLSSRLSWDAHLVMYHAHLSPEDQALLHSLDRRQSLVKSRASKPILGIVRLNTPSSSALSTEVKEKFSSPTHKNELLTSISPKGSQSVQARTSPSIIVTSQLPQSANARHGMTLSKIPPDKLNAKPIINGRFGQVAPTVMGLSRNSEIHQLASTPIVVLKKLVHTQKSQSLIKPKPTLEVSKFKLQSSEVNTSQSPKQLTVNIGNITTQGKTASPPEQQTKCKFRPSILNNSGLHKIAIKSLSPPGLATVSDAEENYKPAPKKICSDKIKESVSAVVNKLFSKTKLIQNNQIEQRTITLHQTSPQGLKLQQNYVAQLVPNVGPQKSTTLQLVSSGGSQVMIIPQAQVTSSATEVTSSPKSLLAHQSNITNLLRNAIFQKLDG